MERLKFMEYSEIWFDILRISIILSSLIGAYVVLNNRHFLRFWVLIIISIFEGIFLFNLNHIIPDIVTRTIFLSFILICTLLLGFTNSFLKCEAKTEKFLRKYHIIPQ